MSTQLIKEENSTTSSRYLTFIIEAEQYGIDIGSVIEIIGMQKITQVPEQPDYVNGVINLRGKIIPTIDIRTRFKKSRIEYDERTCIIVLDINTVLVGVIVDRVSEVNTINHDTISEPPSFNTDFSNRFVRGIARVEEEIIILVNINKLLSEDELLETAKVK